VAQQAQQRRMTEEEYLEWVKQQQDQSHNQ